MCRSNLRESDTPFAGRILVTFAVFAYNQEKYICEAVRGAFSQTYEPLEIIISDDCSTDKTFEIIQQMVANYYGPHEIVINKNEINLGISPHVRKIHEISRGRFIVHAAGDDISMPNRTSVLKEAFEAHGSNVFMVISNADKTSLKGEDFGLLSNEKEKIVVGGGSVFRSGIPGKFGCTAAVDKKIVEAFPPPSPMIATEDDVLLRRALILGKVIYIPDVLVKYRIGDGVSHRKTSSRVNAERYVKNIDDQLLRLQQLVQDANSIGYQLSGQDLAALKKEIYRLTLTQSAIHGNIFSLIRLTRLISFRSFLRFVLTLIIYKMPRA